MSKQSHSFQAEVAQLLHLVTHSLYSNKEIFLRELVSNASDACDKLRFEALNDSALFENDSEIKIRISLDPEQKTITITDNGIGMSVQEAIDNLGTIAKSGTKDFVSKLTGEQKSDSQLIGQFGVGFYSGFIVADKLTVESRRAGFKPEEAVRWVSDGGASGGSAFETEIITRAQRGTSVTLHLREDSIDFAQAWTIKALISKYSDHIGLPIQMEVEKWEDGPLIDPSKEDGGREPGKMVKTGEWETVNKATALWTRAKKDISKEDYESFYQQISHDHAPPLAYTHNRVEGNLEYTQLLYLPAKAPFDLYQREMRSGLKLYVKRIFIMDDAEKLLPNYLRFVKGVVDTADLPLNVSRELLQESRDVKAIREGCAKRVLGLLEDLAQQDQVVNTDNENADATVDMVDVAVKGDKSQTGKYTQFYAEFGPVLKEGLGEDPANKERIAKLLRFYSTKCDSQTVSFADYKARMKEGQEAIYYIAAEGLEAAKNSPQIEMFKKKGIEVLLLSDRIDEWAFGFFHEFDGTPLENLAKGAFDLGKLQNEEEKKAQEEAAQAIEPLLAKLKEALKNKTQNVRATSRLVDSPACLVVEEFGMSPQMARLMQQMGQKVPESKPIMEVNPDHPLIKKLDGSVRFDELAHILFDQALLAEGVMPDNPAEYVKRINALLL